MSKHGGALAGYNRVRAFFTRDFVSRAVFLLCVLLLVALRLFIAGVQRVYLTTDGAPLDDGLMMKAAMELSAGNWLGAYTSFAIAKNMGFALWLALVHAVGVPYLVANAALWALCCLFAAFALRPVFSGRLARLLLFAFLLFCPVSFAAFTLRAYRDAVFPSVCLLLFAGAAGFALRLPEKPGRGLWLCALGAGAGLAAGWLLREDGALLLPFAVCAFALAGLFALLRKDIAKRALKIILCAVPFLLLVAGVFVFSFANYLHYGVFFVNDLTQGAFPRAYGAMAAVSRAESGYTERIPVTRAALAKLEDASPTLALLHDDLTGGPALHGFAHPETGEYLGSFYYSLRVAADAAGVAKTAREAQAFWAAVEAEIAAAVADGRLKSEKPASSTVPLWDAQLFAPTAKEAAAGALHLMRFRECDPRPPFSTGAAAEVAAQAAYLHASPQAEGFVAGTDQIYYNLPQRLAFGLCDVLTWVYRIAVWPLFAAALARMVWALCAFVRKTVCERRFAFGLLCAAVLLGLMLSVLLRVGVAAYMEVAAFHIGTYLMYLSSAAPPLLLFCALGCAPWPGAREDA